MSIVGTGTPSFTFAAVSGTVRHFGSPADVIESLDSDLESTIALVKSGGTTFLGPILGRLGGIVCLDGTLRSHLAIVSREFEVPCLVGTDLTRDIADGTEVTLGIESGAGLLRTEESNLLRTEESNKNAEQAWWAYIRRVGDEIAVKDFDLTVSGAALEELIATELTDDRLDDLIGHMDERLEEIRTVVDFWRRLTLAHRGDGTLDYKDAGFTHRYLPESQVDALTHSSRRLDPAAAKALKRLNATVSGYSFLYFCDSRVGICDSGPYPQPDGRHTIVRDYLSLGPSAWGYPWAEKLRPPYAGLTMALTFDPAAFTDVEINDWGTTFTEPDQLLAAVTEATLVGHRPDGGTEVLEPDRWAGLTTELSHAHMDLYQEFARMDRPQRIWAATRMYTSGLRPFAQAAGVLDQVGWAFSPDTTALYPDPLDDDNAAAAIFGTALVANDMPGSFSPIR